MIINPVFGDSLVRQTGSFALSASSGGGSGGGTRASTSNPAETKLNFAPSREAIATIPSSVNLGESVVKLIKSTMKQNDLENMDVTMTVGDKDIPMYSVERGPQGGTRITQALTTTFMKAGTELLQKNAWNMVPDTIAKIVEDNSETRGVGSTLSTERGEGDRAEIKAFYDKDTRTLNFEYEKIPASEFE